MKKRKSETRGIIRCWEQCLPQVSGVSGERNSGNLRGSVDVPLTAPWRPPEFLFFFDLGGLLVIPVRPVNEQRAGAPGETLET